MLSRLAAVGQLDRLVQISLHLSWLHRSDRLMSHSYSQPIVDRLPLVHAHSCAPCLLWPKP